MTRSSTTFLRINKELILIAILIIFYTVGTIGILLPGNRDFFLSLSPFNLALSFTIVVLSRKQNGLKFSAFLVLCYFTGMAAEWIGTQTGLLFGNYTYGNNLGTKWNGVPFVIGLNWGILIVTSASLVSKVRLPIFISAVLSSLLMTSLDVLMEPVAIKSDFWNWTDGFVPFYNYACWFMISLPLHWIYFGLKLSESNKVYDSLFIILILFFLLLNSL